MKSPSTNIMYTVDLFYFILFNVIERRCHFQGPRRILLQFCGGSAMKNMVILTH